MRRFLAFLFIYAVVVFALHLWFGDWPAITQNVEAQSGRTFYIDAASGSNSFDGTEKTHTTGVTGPWKSHPYMQTPSGCTGTGSAPSYAHQSGDTFIFKGGVTWVASCFPMNLVAGGTPTARDYYGVDQTWFSGGSWTRPLFELSLTRLSSVISANTSFSGYATFDSFEIAHQGIILPVSTGNGAAYEFRANNSVGTGVVIENNYIHDWATTDNVSSTNLDYHLGVVDAPQTFLTSNGVQLLNSTVEDDAGYFFHGGTQIFGGFGGACENCFVVSGNTFHDLYAACFSNITCHDNEFYNFDLVGIGNYTNYPAGIHSQVAEDDGGGNASYYNNYFHNNHSAVTMLVCPGSPIYNSVFTNSTNQAPINVSPSFCPGNPPASATEYVFNNTIDGTATGCLRSTASGQTIGTFYIQNNICITSNGSDQLTTAIGNPVTNPHYSNNRNMNSTEATTYGFIQASKYSPSSADPNTVAQGLNLTSFCSSSLTALCTDPRSASWFGGSGIARGSAFDIGAFQFKGGPVGPPSSSITAPANGATISGPTVSLTATCTPQGTATVSNIQFFVDGISFGAAGSSSPYTVTLDSTKIANASHTISDTCTDSNSQTGTGGPITVTASNSIPGCFVSNPVGATQQGFTAQTATFTAAWTETPNSTGTNDTVVGLAAIPATAYSQISALLRSNTSGFWDAWNNAVPGYTSVGSAPYVGGTTYSFSGTLTFVSGNLVNYSISETAPSSIVIASGYTPRAAATSLAYLVGISDAGVYDTAKVCNFQVAGSITLSYSPGALNFGPVVNTTTSMLTESVSVTGGPATIASAVVAGTGFSLDGSSTCPTSGSLGSSCTYIVDFTPPSTGSYMGTLTVTSTATGSPQVINLSGSGIAPAATFSLSQNSLNFGDILIHSTAAAGPIVIVVANGPSTGSSVSFSGPNAADFALASNTWTGSVASSAQTVVSFTPTCGGGQPPCSESATMTYTSGNATSAAPAVTLTGRGVITIPVAPGPQMFVWTKCACNPHPFSCRCQ